MRTFIGLLLALAVAGCGADHDHDHDGPDDDHNHVAPGGGLLVELGEHEGNVQFLFDGKKGELTARLWGPHAEHPVRSDAAALDVTVQVGGKEIALKLLPYYDPLSGEKAGATSTFKVQDEALVGATAFTGRVGPLTLRGVDFATTDFAWPPN